MSDVTEGLGGIVEGALVGGALEKERGSGGVGASTADGACLNCGAEPLGNFCQACGQKVHVHRTLSAIGHDLIHGVLHLDGKFWKTLPLLLFKPGQLTRRYIDGERAKFVSPMAMFLLSVFAMFAVFQMIGLTPPTNIDMGDTVEAVREQGAERIEVLENEIAAMPEGEARRAELEAELADLKALLDGSDGAVDSPTTSEETDQTPGLDEFLTGMSDALGESSGEGATIRVGGSDAFGQALINKWRENPGLMLYKMQANAYKFSWLLIPISVPFVWLLFLFRRRFKAYDHAVFVTYSISFVSLLFIALSLLTALGVGGGWLFAALAIIPPLHLYKSLRYTYSMGRLSTLWRLLALSVFIWVVIVLFLWALVMLGAF